MASAVRNTVNSLDISLAESLRMASLYPAQYLNLKKKGRLLDGFDADFIVLDEHQYVKATYIAGNRI
jgi:N-acetylglucosamine-6-phosphate deacetylase